MTSTVIVIVIGTLAAYALTSFRLPGANTIAGAILVGKLVPTISMVLPLFVIINAIGLRGSLGGPDHRPHRAEPALRYLADDGFRPRRTARDLNRRR